MIGAASGTERSHRGLVRRFAKPLSGVTCSEGSNPSLSAIRTPDAARAPVAQWIERQVADLKVVSSSLAGRAKIRVQYGLIGSPMRPSRLLGFPISSSGDS